MLELTNRTLVNTITPTNTITIWRTINDHKIICIIVEPSSGMLLYQRL